MDREAPGIVHLLLSTSLQHTPLGALSRPVAGTSGVPETLIVTLPGSTKAVKETLDALLSSGVIEHALELMKGGTGRGAHLSLTQTRTIGNVLGKDQRHTHEHNCAHHERKPSHGHKRSHSGSFSGDYMRKVCII